MNENGKIYFKINFERRIDSMNILLCKAEMNKYEN